MSVAPFVTCFNDALYPRTGQAVVRLLERLGGATASSDVELDRVDGVRGSRILHLLVVES